MQHKEHAQKHERNKHNAQTHNNQQREQANKEQAKCTDTHQTINRNKHKGTSKLNKQTTINKRNNQTKEQAT
jgi:hypothetical protein